MKVRVISVGYVGLIAAACLAEMNNSVVGLDVDEALVTALGGGEMPIHEPGLAELTARNIAAGRLRFTCDAASAVARGTILFIAVGTPPADLVHVMSVAHAIGRYMNDYRVIVDKSTVSVGTAERVRDGVAEALHARGAIVPYAVVSNPEFLKKGAAIDDFMRPDRVVLGADNERALLLMRALYAPFLRNRDRLLAMDVRSAELTKYAANACAALAANARPSRTGCRFRAAAAGCRAPAARQRPADRPGTGGRRPGEQHPPAHSRRATAPALAGPERDALPGRVEPGPGGGLGSTIIVFAPPGFRLCEGIASRTRLRAGQALMYLPPAA
jgi:hypothetical protein